MIRLFIETALRCGEEIELDAYSMHYLLHVMRCRRGDFILLFNGRDGEFSAELTDLNKKKGRCYIVEKRAGYTPSPDFRLYFSPIKNSPQQWLAEKATELGVARLQPVLCQHTQARPPKIPRLRRITEHAAAQCRRLDVPLCKLPLNLNEALAELKVLPFFFFCDETSRHDRAGAQPLLEALLSLRATQYEVRQKKRLSPIAFLIGPEGGFCAPERDMIRRVDGCIAVQLGARLLKADTAALYALSILQAAFEL